MSEKRIKLLVIEDDPAVVCFIREALSQSPRPGFEYVFSGTVADGARELARGGIDLVLLDYTLPDGEGLNGLKQLHAQAPELPMVVLLPAAEDEQAFKMLREGAQDCLVKEDMRNGHLTRAIRFAIERKRGEETRYRLAAIVESSRDAIIGMSLEGLIVSWNPGAERIFGYSFEEVIGRAISALAPPDYPDEVPLLLELLKRGEFIKDFETVRIKKNDQPIHVAASISPIINSTGTIIGASMIARDIEERIRAEREREALLRQLQATLAQVKTLSGLLPICASCKKIRDDQGYWTQVEVYVHDHSQAEFTHGICPECAAKYRATMPQRR